MSPFTFPLVFFVGIFLLSFVLNNCKFFTKHSIQCMLNCNLSWYSFLISQGFKECEILQQKIKKSSSSEMTSMGSHHMDRYKTWRRKTTDTVSQMDSWKYMMKKKNSLRIVHYYHYISRSEHTYACILHSCKQMWRVYVSIHVHNYSKCMQCLVVSYENYGSTLLNIQGILGQFLEDILLSYENFQCSSKVPTGKNSYNWLPSLLRERTLAQFKL